MTTQAQTELDLMIEARQLEIALTDAKDAKAASPDDENVEADYRAAKAAIRAHRQFWREIRALHQAGLLDTPAVIAEGDAVASPDTHGIGVSADMEG